MREDLWGSVFQNQLGLILDREQFLDLTFPHENAMREDAHPVANLLHLREKMRGEQNRDAAPFEIENQIANLARASRVDAGRGLVEHD